MQLLIELGQLAIALVISAVVAIWVGPTYVAVSALVMMTCLVLLFDSVRHRSMITEEPIGIRAALGVLGTSVAFGLIWPAIPLIFTWKRVGASVVDE